MQWSLSGNKKVKSVKHLILAFLLATSYNSFAGKTFQLKLEIVALASREPIEGLRVVLMEKEDTVAIGYTSTTGIVVFEKLKEKSFMIEFDDTSGLYNTHKRIPLLNKAKVDRKMKVSLRWAAELEERFFLERKESAQRAWKAAEQEEEETAPPNCGGIGDEETMFPGGAAAMQQFLSENLQYPEESIAYAEQGRVYLSFVIEKNGEVSNLKVERGISRALDHEAKMLVYYMPPWKPGMCDGNPIRTRIRLPVIFRIE